MIINKYRKEDGTIDAPTYEDLHPECTLYQYGTLMNDNTTMKTRAIDEYRRQYLEAAIPETKGKNSATPVVHVPR
jgi:hypothetical protein